MSSPNISSPSSLASTSSTLTEERSTCMMANIIKKYKTEELIERWEDLDLDNDDLSILHKQKISGFSFLELTEEKFLSIGLALGPATALAKSQKAENMKLLLQKLE
ncbi:19319_t:CDS:1 [Dentiscutata erythropus]|uniref:19319_t:CDS:1 n=1 Tax=Dentiscutata erythropus TaxID=1348616 RepID=A0A9N9GT31_9GLOM|nr:19319_t:CDS:1 [Dentiscutata erythropus]